MTQTITPELLAYLTAWHATTVRKKLEAGNEVDLPFDDFLGLFEKRQLKSLQRAIDDDRLQGLQNRNNEFAYVATWRSYAACSSGRYDKTTAIVCSRLKSKAINQAKPGDTLRPSHRENIRKSLTGVSKSDEHKASISAALKGANKSAWSPERKAERRALNEAKRAAKQAAQIGDASPTAV